MNDGGRRRKIKEDLKFWRKELRERSNAATKAILQRADVVLVTLTSATEDGPIRFLEENHFDMVVIDEVSQVNRINCLFVLKLSCQGIHHFSNLWISSLFLI